MGKAWKRGRFMPPSVNIPGFSSSYTQPNYKKGIPGGASVTMDPAQQALRDRYTGLLNQGLDQVSAPLTNVGGFGAISPEMYQEFQNSNSAAGPQAFYDQAGFDSMLGSYRGMADTANAEAQRMLSQGTQGNMDYWLNLLRQQAAGQENNVLQGNADKQFLRGILGSSAGAYQTQGVMDSINQADLARQLQAYGMSQDAINQALSRAGSLTGQYTGMEGDAANRMFQVNNANYSRVADRFNRAAGLFGMGMNQQNVDFARALQIAGAGQGFLSSQDQQIQQMLNSMYAAGAMQSNANNGAMANQIAANAANTGLLGQVIGAAGNIAGSYFGGPAMTPTGGGG